MKVFSPYLVALASATMAMAGWESLGDPTSTPCSETCNSISPVFKDRNFEKVCNKLVKNGCDDKRAAVGLGGALVFAHRDVVGCETSRPASLEECKRVFKAAYVVPGVIHGMGGAQSWAVDVKNGEGVLVGRIAISGSCAPVSPDPLAGC